MDFLHYLMAKMEVFRTFKRDERAVTAMEYGLIAALIAVVIIAGLTTLGTTLNTKFATIASALTPAAAK